MSTQPQRVRPGLRPLPFRGDLISAGAIPLAVGAVLLDLRMTDAWAAGVRAAVLAIVAALLLTLAWRAPVEGPNPRAYVSVLLFSAFPVAAVGLLTLAEALGGEGRSAGMLTWTALVLGVGYLVLARARNSGTCTLLGGTALSVAVMAFWSWAFTFELWPCLVLLVVLGLGVVVLRDHHAPHAVALADVAGVIGVYVGWADLNQGLDVLIVPGDDPHPLAWGWKLALVATGSALIGYGAVDRERGPAWLGALVLVTFVIGASIHASVLWWPALLIALGLAALVAGLRPTTPTPPSPDADAPPAQEHRFSR
jgi:hypothetical protein